MAVSLVRRIWRANTAALDPGIRQMGRFASAPASLLPPRPIERPGSHSPTHVVARGHAGLHDSNMGERGPEYRKWCADPQCAPRCIPEQRGRGPTSRPGLKSVGRADSTGMWHRLASFKLLLGSRGPLFPFWDKKTPPVLERPLRGLAAVDISIRKTFQPIPSAAPQWARPAAQGSCSCGQVWHCR